MPRSTRPRACALPRCVCLHCPSLSNADKSPLAQTPTYFEALAPNYAGSAGLREWASWAAGVHVYLFVYAQDALDAVERRLAAVDATDSALECDEERGMGVVRVSVAEGSASPFDHDLSFVFDERVAHGAGGNELPQAPSSADGTASWLHSEPRLW